MENLDLAQLAWFLIILLAIGELAIFFIIRNALKKVKRLFGGTKKATVLEVIEKCISRTEKVEKQLKNLADTDKEFKAFLRFAVCKVGVVRFNPFKNMGGEQSFSIALLNTEDTGVVLTGIARKDGTSVYAKQLTKGKSKHQLSAEEEKAIKEAVAP